jgi:hypothetical protein
MSIYETCSEKIGAISSESLPLLLECLSDTQEEVSEKWHAMSFYSKISTVHFLLLSLSKYTAS